VGGGRGFESPESEAKQIRKMASLLVWATYERRRTFVDGGRGRRGPKDFVVPFSDTTNFAITPDAATAAAAATTPFRTR